MYGMTKDETQVWETLVANADAHALERLLRRGSPSEAFVSALLETPWDNNQVVSVMFSNLPLQYLPALKLLDGGEKFFVNLAFRNDVSDEFRLELAKEHPHVLWFYVGTYLQVVKSESIRHEIMRLAVEQEHPEICNALLYSNYTTPDIWDMLIDDIAEGRVAPRDTLLAYNGRVKNRLRSGDLDRLYATGNVEYQRAVAGNRNISRELLLEASHHEDKFVRWNAAGNPRATKVMLMDMYTAETEPLVFQRILENTRFPIMEFISDLENDGSHPVYREASSAVSVSRNSRSTAKMLDLAYEAAPEDTLIYVARHVNASRDTLERILASNSHVGVAARLARTP